MSQRQFVRPGDMELHSSGFQSESATPQAVGDEIQSSNSHSQSQELQQLRGGALLNSAAAAVMMNRRFSLLDILHETLYLAGARRTYLLVFLSIYISGVLLLQGFDGYLTFQKRQNDLSLSSEARDACVRDILRPWTVAARRETLTSAQQEEFYTSFEQNCTMFFKSPAEEVAVYTFRNGTMEIANHTGFTAALPLTTHFVGGLGSWLMDIAWTTWGQVALTWGLHFASTRTIAYRPPQYRDRSIQSKRSPSQTLKEMFREMFAFRVLRGVIRVTLTEMLIATMSGIFTTFMVLVRVFVKHKSFDGRFLTDTTSGTSHWWDLADPIPFLFLLSSAGAALEPGMWGFKALERGFEIARGNRFKSYLMFLLLFFWSWLVRVVTNSTALKPEHEMIETPNLMRALWRSMQSGGFIAMNVLPKFFLVPVFYFLCTSWSERLDTMA